MASQVEFLLEIFSKQVKGLQSAGYKCILNFQKEFRNFRFKNEWFIDFFILSSAVKK